MIFENQQETERRTRRTRRTIFESSSVSSQNPSNNQPKTVLQTLKPAKQQSNKPEYQNSQQKSKIRIKTHKNFENLKTLIFQVSNFRKFFLVSAANNSEPSNQEPNALIPIVGPLESMDRHRIVYLT